MAKIFYFSDPEQLKEIEAFAKEGSVLNVARVWSAAKRKSEKTAWDGKIGISFSTENRQRKACVFRCGLSGERNVIALVKYAPALKWCLEHDCTCE
ncbi:MAG: hypothetical protein E7322_05785 [Clostridiales bacterium]|nr:hypothetical protein [Clostridiales bacterium]